MDFDAFVEGPLLWIVFLLFLVGVFTRFCFFVYSIIKNDKYKGFRSLHLLAVVGRFVVPFHSAIRNHTIYAILRYAFHVCLIVVPICLSGHIVLWEESRFEWNWVALPDIWADGMTLLLLCLASYFLVRRIIFPAIRASSGPSDYFLIVITALPFLTGFFLTHGNLDALPFLANNILVIHVLSGEVLIIVTLVLFYAIQLNVNKCTGCTTCTINCPTRTLEFNDEENLRVFNYSHYQCICCGVCVTACPEGAVGFLHEMKFGRFFQLFPKREIRSIELKACERCGKVVAPVPQVGKIGETISSDYIRFCLRCRKVNLADTLCKLVSRPKNLK